MNAAIVIVPLLALAAAAAGGGSRRYGGSSSRSSTSPEARARAAERVCRYTAQTLPLDSDRVIHQWARCAGRTGGEVEGVAGRGAAAGWSSARIDALRRVWQQAQALAQRPPDGLSARARRDVDRALDASDAQARSRPLPSEPQTLSLEDKIAIDRERTEARARARAEQESAISQAGSVVSGASSPAVEIEIESPASGYDPSLARRLASQAARAVRDRLPGAALNVQHFRQAAGLGPGGYDARTEAALRHFGIRRPPPSGQAAEDYTPPVREVRS